MLCPKCEAWCANDPFFICGYSCQDIQHIEYDHKLGNFYVNKIVEHKNILK